MLSRGDKVEADDGRGSSLSISRAPGARLREIANMVRAKNGETIAQCLEGLYVENDTLTACGTLVE